MGHPRGPAIVLLQLFLANPPSATLSGAERPTKQVVPIFGWGLRQLFITTLFDEFTYL